MFGFGIDRKSLYIFLVVLFMINLLSGAISLEGFLLSLPGIIVAMTFHEFAHAFAATKLGDDTPRLQGRLNLNPLSHTDPVGLLCLALCGFGWGKPVQINPRNFDRKYSLTKAEAIVSIAGPLMNFILAFIFVMVSMAMSIFIKDVTRTIYIIAIIINSIVSVNLCLGIFNLIPIYPLDGSKVLFHFLPIKARQWVIENQGLLTLILMAIIILPTGASIIIGNIANAILSGMVAVSEFIFELFI